MYLERAMEVPPSKLHHKLLQATRVIIQLVKEKEILLDREKTLRRELHRLLREGEKTGGREGASKEGEIEGGTQRDYSSIVAVCTCGSTSQRRVCQPLVETRGTSDPVPEEETERSVRAQGREDRGEGGGTKGTRRVLRKTQTSCRTEPLSPPSPPHLPPADLSLSPLKFSDSSVISNFQAAERALKMADMSFPLPSSPAHTKETIAARSSTPVKELEEEEENVGLLVEGSKVPAGGRGRSRQRYVPPKLKKPSKMKARNYNIKD